MNLFQFYTYNNEAYADTPTDAPRPCFSDVFIPVPVVDEKVLKYNFIGLLHLLLNLRNTPHLSPVHLTK